MKENKADLRLMLVFMSGIYLSFQIIPEPKGKLNLFILVAIWMCTELNGLFLGLFLTIPISVIFMWMVVFSVTQLISKQTNQENRYKNDHVYS